MDQPYPTQPCLAGNLIFGSAPKIPGTSSSTLCPNGDVTFGNRRDGRVYNLHQYTQGDGYRLDTELGPVPSVVGNFSRTHTTRTLVAAAPSCPGTGGDKRCCSQDDATSQIGCMTEADQCSFGFAGGEVAAQVLTTTAGTELAFSVSLNNIKYDPACVVSVRYPLARLAYLNALIGFENVTGQELAFTKCVAGGATGYASLLAANNLFALPTGPVCVDFPNEGCSTNDTPGNACTGNAAVGLPE
ncbi:MAG: hypothetical protein WDO69_13725 [Pseudomonadota bacterium]